MLRFTEIQAAAIMASRRSFDERQVAIAAANSGEFVGNAATLLAEALVHLIERDFDILPKHEAAQLRQDAADAPDGTRTIVVHELTTSGPELLHLTVGKSTDHVAITTPAIKALARRFEAQ